jgi:UDP-N-acetylmuramate dehydrogenase
MIQHHISLKPYNTFGVEVYSKRYATVDSLESFIAVYQQKNIHEPLLILGGGSNILLTKDFEGLVIKNESKGIEICFENEDEAIVRVQSGEVWHPFVLWTLAHGFYGLENLSLIPGTVGACPIQNIGAYGAEVKDFIISVLAYDLEELKLVEFSNEACQFGYRDSIFKREAKGKYWIVSVDFKLSKTPHLQANYKDIQEYFENHHIENATPQQLSDAVVAIRSYKLPDPTVLGNAGSFFKNPVISKSLYDHLYAQNPQMPSYPDPNGVKIPAGWLIEQAGFKGQRQGDAGTHHRQALVIVNHGNASGNELFDWSQKIIDNVYKQFKISLEREVNCL